MKILLPQQLLFWLKEVEKNPPIISGFKISRLEYLISTIITNKQDNHQGAYSLLNMGYLRNVVPNAGEYMRFLRDSDIIEWVNYSASRNSRLYRLISEGHTVYRTITDKALIRRVNIAFRKRGQNNSKKYPRLNKYVHAVSIDIEAALHTIEHEYERRKTDDPEKAEARRTYSMGEIEKIYSKETFTSVNTTNYRYDSNFTRLPSELVYHLHFGGSPLIEIDIANSQPFFASCLFDPTPEVELVMLKCLGRKDTEYIKNIFDPNSNDILEYQFLTSKGIFYEYMMNCCNNPDRNSVKKQIFMLFFSRNNVYRYNPTAKIFMIKFPLVNKVFNYIKREKHNKLSILLQRIESYTILERVVKKIIDEYPELPFLTKHDSILPVKYPMVDVTGNIEKLICDEIIKTTGRYPCLKMKFS